MTLRVFSLTGGLASGKSTVSALFEQAGVPVVDADELAREAVQPGSAALAEIARTFGERFVKDGELDRQALAGEVFADRAKLQALNAIVHPRVRALLKVRLAALDDGGHPLACYSVPLLFETGQEDSFRPVIVVSARREQQMARAEARGWPREHVLARLNSQGSLQDKTARADYVIDNSGSLEHTRSQARAVLAAIRRELGPW